MEREKISVIVPAYNIEKYIARSLDSILNQTYQPIEIVVVDDGSTDGTPEILDDYAREHENVVVIHRKNGGVFTARLDGLEKATGTWIGFVDGDDEIEPEMYELLLSNAKQYKADISHCGYQMMFSDGRIDRYYGTGQCVVQDHDQGVADLLRGRMVEPGLWNKLYRRKLFSFLESVTLDHSIKINEDLLLNYYLFQQSKCSIFEDRCCYHYMIRANSAATSNINENKLNDPSKVLHTILADCEPGSAHYNIVMSRMCGRLVSVASMDVKENPSLILPYRREARQELRKRLNSFLRCSSCSSKLKVMALWCAVAPGSYGAVHRIYARLTGLDKKYSTGD